MDTRRFGASHERQPDGSEKQFAVKRVILDRRDAEQVALVEHEVNVLRSLPPHPNVVELIGTCRRQRGAAGAQDEYFMLLELCRGGSLADLLMARSMDQHDLHHLTPHEVAKAFFEMALALSHLHAQSPPLAHRDVKPENFILSDLDGRWRLCDFGSATTKTFDYIDGTTTTGQIAMEEDRIHRYSTPQYRAPEMCDLRRGEHVGVAVDVWALGVSLYKLLFLQDLFGTPGEERLGTLNFDPNKKLKPSVLPRFPPTSAASSEVLLDLLRLCLTPSAAKRPPIDSVLQWLHTRSNQIENGVGSNGGGGRQRASAFDRPTDMHRAGLLTISKLHCSGLFPKSVSGGGVKAYVLITCGGARRVTIVAPKAHEASWTEELSVPTHALQSLELTVWAFHTRTTHDFLGAVVLSLPTVIDDPSQPLQQPERSVMLQKRSHKSRVSGELSFALSWEPFAAPPPTSPPPQAQKPKPKPPSPTLIENMSSNTSAADHAAAAFDPFASSNGGGGGGGGAGSFWSRGFADNSFAAFDAPAALFSTPQQPQPPQQQPVSAPLSPLQQLAQSHPPAASSSSFAGSFWASEAATTTSWSNGDQQPQQQQAQPPPIARRLPSCSLHSRPSLTM